MRSMAPPKLDRGRAASVKGVALARPGLLGLVIALVRCTASWGSWAPLRTIPSQPQRHHVVTGDIEPWSVGRCTAADHRHTLKMAALIDVVALEAINERPTLESDAAPDRCRFLRCRAPPGGASGTRSRARRQRTTRAGTDSNRRHRDHSPPVCRSGSQTQRWPMTARGPPPRRRPPVRRWPAARPCPRTGSPLT